VTAPGTTRGRSILLVVEDNRADVRLIQESLKDVSVVSRLHVVEDGEQAMAFLRRQGEYADAPHPDLVLLDLNLPRRCGMEVLAEIRADHALRHISVVILSSSDAEEDVYDAYYAGANCYVTKPIDLDEFVSSTQALVRFWLEVARLPES
jgi:two-component system, chemotaxis family, response regulator Rcp1